MKIRHATLALLALACFAVAQNVKPTDYDIAMCMSESEQTEYECAMMYINKRLRGTEVK